MPFTMDEGEVASQSQRLGDPHMTFGKEHLTNGVSQDEN